MELKPNFDYQKYGIDREAFYAEAEHLLSKLDEDEAQTVEHPKANNLEIILATSEKLRVAKGKEIRFADPILMQGENPFIYPQTINVIQGQAGVHKSRLAETLCSSVLKKSDCKNELLGFKLYNPFAEYTIVYVDTERNLSHQYPKALQTILTNAGYCKEDNPPNFLHPSLLQIPRKERFETLNQYLDFVRRESSKPLIIVLDVATDCIEDFNKVEKSMELIDLMNVAINEYNVTFVCIVHENPSSNKARGHFGTELMNKASTVLQIGFEKDAKQNDIDLIGVKYLKCRHTAKPLPFYCKYNKDCNGLVLANESEISEIDDYKRHKANNRDLLESLQKHLGAMGQLSRTELLEKLCHDLGAKERTIEARLSDLLKSDLTIYNNEGDSCRLKKQTNGNKAFYQLFTI